MQINVACISKINGKLIENAEDLNIVMPMYNLLEYSKNYRKTTWSFFNYYRDELSDGANNPNSLNKNVINSKYFKYKTSILGNAYNIPKQIRNNEGDLVNNPNYDVNNEGKKETKIVIPLKYLSNFGRNLDMPLINCQISLTLSWYENSVITSLEKPVIEETNPQQGDNSPTNAVFKITDAKLYVPVVTLSSEEDNELLNSLKTGFKRIIRWNKYMSQMSNQVANNNLNYLIDPTFSNVNRLFVLSFQNEEDRTSFSNYYLPKIKIKDFNVLIDGKPFFEIPVKNKEETYEKIIEISKNSNYTTGNLLDYEYFTTRSLEKITTN